MLTSTVWSLAPTVQLEVEGLRLRYLQVDGLREGLEAVHRSRDLVGAAGQRREAEIAGCVGRDGLGGCGTGVRDGDRRAGDTGLGRIFDDARYATGVGLRMHGDACETEGQCRSGNAKV